MKILNQKKYKILIATIVILMAVFQLLYDSYNLFRTPLIGNLHYIVIGSLVWTLLFFLRKENLKPAAKAITNLFFVLVTVAFPLAFILEMIGL